MVFNKYNSRIIFFISLILIMGFGGFYFISENELGFAIPFFFVIIILVTSLLYFLNSTNRKIAYFIDAVKNEDSTLKFPENVKNPAQKKLHQSLNKVNEFITQSKIQVEHKEKFYEALIEHSATGLISIDEEGEFEILNNTARQYMGVEFTANIHMLKQKNHTLYQVLKTIKPGETTTVKLFVNSIFYHLSVRCTEIKYFSKKLKLISLHNIRFELEEKEIESWQKLFRVITHEIMNSIAPITSVSNTLGRMYKDKDSLKHQSEVSEKMIADTVQGLEVIEDMSNGLMNFVNSYRSLNKIPKPEFKEIKIKLWMDNLSVMAHKIISEENVSLEFSIKSGVTNFMGDENLLNQVLINLIKNANEALENKKDGKIKVTCYSDQPGKINIEVEDNGYGIDTNNLDQVFIPFFTTKESGTGIGLSLCRQIIRLHEGNISVRSEKGEGTIFTISI